MEKVITIPKEIAKKGDLVLIPRREYEEFLRMREQKKWEEKDTDEAIRIFEKERKAGKLKKASSFAEILK